MLKLMEFNDESTWAPDILSYLTRNQALPKLGKSGSVAGTTTPQAYDKTIEGLRAVLNNHSLHGYHCTRLTAGEIKTIENEGMQLPDGSMLRRRIQRLQTEGVIAEHVAKALIENNQADASHPERAKSGLVLLFRTAHRRRKRNRFALTVLGRRSAISFA